MPSTPRSLLLFGMVLARVFSHRCFSGNGKFKKHMNHDLQKCMKHSYWVVLSCTMVLLAVLGLLVRKNCGGCGRPDYPLMYTSSEGVFLAFSQDFASGKDRLLEYRTDKLKLESLPVWELGDETTNGFTVSLDRIIEIAREDASRRFGVHQENLYLEDVSFCQVPDQKESRWFYTVRFTVNKSSRYYLRNTFERKLMSSVLLMDGSVVEPKMLP